MYVYGSGRCGICNLRGRTHEIHETSRSRFRLMQFFAEMSTSVAGGHISVTGATAHNFMMGLLICGSNILVAASGNNDTKPFIIAAAARKRYIHCVRAPIPMTTRSDLQVTVAQVQNCQAPGGSGPGYCAAPKLISGAIARGFHRSTDVSRWAMSEIMFQPSTDRRTINLARGQLVYDHGLSQPSCPTCEKLIPVLMCGFRA